MAATYQIQVRNRSYTVVDDLTSVYRALITGTIRDEISGLPPRVPLTVQASRDDVDSKVLQDGMFCIAGYPERVFPRLATTSYTIKLAVEATGYQKTAFTVTIPAKSVFPIILPAATLLRRLPVRIQGRVVQDTSTRTPIAEAKIVSTLDPTVVLRTPLHFDHGAGIAIRQRSLTPTGAVKQLVSDAPAGTRSVTLTNRTGLSPGTIVGFGPETQIEYSIIDSLGPGSTTGPGTVMLHNSLHRSFRATTQVRKNTLGPIGTTRNLNQDADAGDGLLRLSAGLAVDTIEILDPAPARREYHAIGALSATNGFYRLDGIGRIAVLRLKVSAAGHNDAVAPWTLDFAQPVNVVDFRLA